jgi:hypothetical protein
MKNIYKISFQIYRAILISILPLFLLAKFMVAMAGHNPDTKITDYALIVFAVLTAILLTVFNKTYQSKSILRNTLRATIISLVLVNIIFLLYGLYNYTLLYFSNNFELENNIPVAVLLLLTALSVTLLIGLIKNKI